MEDVTLQREESGSISGLPLCSILLSVMNKKASGTLELEGLGAKRVIYFENGEAVHVHSTFKADQFLAILLEKELIRKSHAAKIVDMVKKEKKPLAQAFLELGMIQKPEDIAKYHSIHHQEKLKRCFEMLDANFHYKEGSLPKEGLPRVKISIVRGLFDGIRAFYNTNMIKNLLPKLIPENTVRMKENRWDYYESLDLLPEEKGVVSIINDYPVIKDLASASYLEEDDVYKVLFVFCMLDILELETPGDRKDRELLESLNKDERARREQVEKFYKSLSTKSYFDIFGIRLTADNSQVERAYKKLVKAYPMDEISRYFTGSKADLPEKLHSKLLEIKEILIDVDKRREYIAYLKTGKKGDFAEQSQILNAEQKYRQGLAAFQRKDFQRALEILKEASTINPRDARILADLGWAYYVLSSKNSQYKQEALLCLQRSMAADPNEYRPYLYWATLAKKDGKHEEARAFFRETLLRNPASDKAYAELAAINKELADEIVLEGMYEGLDRWNYYEILRVPKNAPIEQIKKSYYKLSKKFHPDKYYSSNDRSRKDKAKVIYKRLVEAYMVLRNPYKRREYDQELISSRGEEGVRLRDAAEVVQRKEGKKATIFNRQAKRFYELAMTALREKNIHSAKMNLRLALNADPENEFLQDKLEEIEEMEKSGIVFTGGQENVQKDTDTSGEEKEE